MHCIYLTDNTFRKKYRHQQYNNLILNNTVQYFSGIPESYSKSLFESNHQNTSDYNPAYIYRNKSTLITFVYSSKHIRLPPPTALSLSDTAVVCCICIVYHVLNHDDDKLPECLLLLFCNSSLFEYGNFS